MRPKVKLEISETPHGGSRAGAGRPSVLGLHQRFLLRIPTKLHRAIHRWADARGRSLNSVIVEAAEQWWATQVQAAVRKPISTRAKSTKKVAKSGSRRRRVASVDRK